MKECSQSERTLLDQTMALLRPIKWMSIPVASAKAPIQKSGIRKDKGDLEKKITRWNFKKVGYQMNSVMQNYISKTKCKQF